MTIRGLGIGLSLCALLACPGPGWAQPLDVSYEQIWGNQAALPLVPIRVKVNNPGSARQVVLTMEDGHGRQRTAVDLPSGARKELEMIVRPTLGPTRLLIQEGFATRVVNLEVASGGTRAGTLAVISDTPGDFSAVRSGRLRPDDPEIRDVYAAPGRAPTRMSAYTGMAAIILSDGAERLTDAEVRAIQQAVVAGTLLVVPTGTPKPILSDPRWQGWWPARVTGSRNVTRLTPFARDGALPQGPLTMATATPVGDAWMQTFDGVLLTASRPVGLGRVLMLGYDPAVGSLRQWDRLGQHLQRVILSERNAVGRQVWSGPARQFTRTDQWSQGVEESGLELKAPPAEFVWLSLGIFLILVGPIQFLILRRLDKGELAWVITPALSVAFAFGVVSVGQRGLSRFQQRETLAVIGVGPAGSVVAGAARQTFFLPEAGSYDMQLAPMDAIGFENSGFGGTEANFAYSREVGDDGVMVLPRLKVNSLAFVPLTLMGEFPAPPEMGGAVEIAGTPRRTLLKGSVTNRTSEPLNMVNLIIGTAPVPWDQPLGNTNWNTQFDRFRRAEGGGFSLWGLQGAIPPGETVKFEVVLSLESVRMLAEGAPVWLVPQLPDTNIGSPLGQSADSSSVQSFTAIEVKNRALARQVAAAIPERRPGGRR